MNNDVQEQQKKIEKKQQTNHKVENCGVYFASSFFCFVHIVVFSLCCMVFFFVCETNEVCLNFVYLCTTVSVYFDLIKTVEPKNSFTLFSHRKSKQTADFMEYEAIKTDNKKKMQNCTKKCKYFTFLHCQKIVF